MVNKAFLIGRLTRKPELRTTNSGIKVCNFSLATSDLRNPRQTYFFNCEAWDRNADTICTYLDKGSLIAIDGRLTTSRFTNRQNVETVVTRIVVDSVKFLNSKAEREEMAASYSSGNEMPNITSPVSAGANLNLKNPNQTAKVDAKKTVAPEPIIKNNGVTFADEEETTEDWLDNLED